MVKSWDDGPGSLQLIALLFLQKHFLPRSQMMTRMPAAAARADTRSSLKTCQFGSVAQLCPTLHDPMDCSMPAFPVHHQLLDPTQTHVHESVMPSNHLILCHALLLPPSIFLSIRVFSNELVLHIRWPKYWSFSFSISPSKEHSGLISFRID